MRLSQDPPLRIASPWCALNLTVSTRASKPMCIGVSSDQSKSTYTNGSNRASELSSYSSDKRSARSSKIAAAAARNVQGLINFLFTSRTSANEASVMT